MAAYFGLGAAVARYSRRLAGRLTRAGHDAQQRETRLGVRRARLEEFGRLHDEAVQVLEQAARGAPPSAELRAYAARAAARLRAETGPGPASCTLLRALTRVADDFATLGFQVSVRHATPSEATGLVVDGYTNAEIARMLGVSERTVDGHLENLKQKMCETRRVRVAIRLKELGYQRGRNAGSTAESQPRAGR